MLTATLLLVIGGVGMVAGLWLLFRKRQRLSGVLLLVAGVVVFFVGFAWPASVVLEGDPASPGEPPAPRRVPTVQETP